MKHKWERSRFNPNGSWKGQRTCLQEWTCKNCGEARDRPDDNSQPNLENCKGGKNGNKS